MSSEIWLVEENEGRALTAGNNRNNLSCEMRYTLVNNKKGNSLGLFGNIISLASHNFPDVTAKVIQIIVRYEFLLNFPLNVSDSRCSCMVHVTVCIAMIWSIKRIIHERSLLTESRNKQSEELIAKSEYVSSSLALFVSAI